MCANFQGLHISQKWRDLPTLKFFSWIQFEPPACERPVELLSAVQLVIRAVAGWVRSESARERNKGIKRLISISYCMYL